MGMEAQDPFSLFFARRGEKAPLLDSVEADALPDPSRSLLAHSGNMTPTLSAHCGVAVGLEVLASEEAGGVVTRWVLLTAREGRPVEFGCIHIYLASLPPSARAEVRAARTPLGRVLAQHGVERESRPTFFACSSEGALGKLLRVEGPPVRLFGRRNAIVSPKDGALIASVVEVLPPL